MRASILFASIAAVSCASDPAEFRPAKGASDMPAVKEAYRVKSVAPECTPLGVVHAEGDGAIDDIAVTAARHGATSYIVRGEDRDERVTTREPDRLVTRTNRKLWAEVYRCPTSDDPPR